jgi:GDPmannose 4,6-dehydratase
MISHLQEIKNISEENINHSVKKVIITGVTGQDGSHMVDYLLKHTDYYIYGCVREFNIHNYSNIIHINSKRFYLIIFDLLDTYNVKNCIKVIRPDYFINFAAQSNINNSWINPKLTWDSNCSSMITILEEIHNTNQLCRIYQSGSSEEFGVVEYLPQNENHVLEPITPYGVSKVASRQIIKFYKNTYNMYVVQGYLFHHEGPRRGTSFVTRKITKNVARIYNDIKNNNAILPLELGNINVSRDWSYVEDFIDGIWKMLNQDIYNINYNGIPKDYVLCSGKANTIKEFVEYAFKCININGYWENKIDENPINEKFYYNNIILVQINPIFYRNIDSKIIYGDYSQINKDLNWCPKTTFYQLIEKMVKNDIILLNIENEQLGY